MQILIDNLYCTVVTTDAQKRRWLSRFLTFAYWKSGEYVVECLYQDEKFPTGFLPLVEDNAPFQLQKTDNRVVPSPIPKTVAKQKGTSQPPVTQNRKTPNGATYKLRDYQVDAVNCALSSVRGILWLPTGSGKTRIAAEIMDRLYVRWLFVVHRADIAIQAAEKFEEYTGEKPGVYAGGKKDRQRVTFATFQSLPNVEWLDEVDGLIIDEVHSLSAATFKSAMYRCPAYFRIGMSGTPLARIDSHTVTACTGPVLKRLYIRDLVSAGVLAKPRITYLPCHQKSKWKTYQGSYNNLVVKSKERNALLVDAIVKAKKPCIVFVKYDKHAKILGKMLDKLACTYTIVTSKTKNRKQVMGDVESGKTTTILCTNVWQDGVDLPSINTVVMAGAGKSTVATLQSMGRGLRVTSDKSSVAVIDIEDTGYRILNDHYKMRKTDIEEEL